ncbi:MAG: hypothetical protein LUH02_04865 [Erysipelotrichaceae bacterium]|nr:hypothetical protein [Erysipelotrichaceae bacterium]
MKLIKNFLKVFCVCCIVMTGIVNVKAKSQDINTNSTIDYTTYTTTVKFTGSLGSANFKSTIKYNNNTGETTYVSSTCYAYPISGYTFSVNDTSGTVTISTSGITIKWKWTLRDSSGNLVDSGTETHKR